MLFNPLYEKLKMYYVTGGMPESVKMWTEARDVSAMQEALSDIISAYERDFAKHPNLTEFPEDLYDLEIGSPLSWQERTRNLSIRLSKKGQELVNMRMLCNGWWMLAWCKIYRSSAPRSSCGRL